MTDKYTCVAGLNLVICVKTGNSYMAD